MLCLIDGYNITKADPSTRTLPLADQREALIARLAISGERLVGKGSLTVVFDGPQEHSSAADTRGIDVRFSKGESADDVIVRLARAARGAVCVVTSDRELAGRVKGAAQGSVRHLEREKLFAGSATSGARGESNRYPASTVGIPKGANRITEELKKVWLEEEE